MPTNYSAAPETGRRRYKCLFGTPSARFAMQGVPAVARAELPQLEAIRVVATVLPGDVVPLLAHRTRQGDLRTDVGRLGHGGVPSCSLNLLLGVANGIPA